MSGYSTMRAGGYYHYAIISSKLLCHYLNNTLYSQQLVEDVDHYHIPSKLIIFIDNMGNFHNQKSMRAADE